MDFHPSGTYTDLYQLAMGQAYYKSNTHFQRVSFDYFFRKIPFKGGYVVFAGLADVLNNLKTLKFTAEDLSFLKKEGFDEAYLNYLKDFKFKGDIYAPKEGEVIFPTEPVLRVEGNIIEVQLIETMLLNILNFQSLIATKAARIKSVSGQATLSEFGLRRSQGYGSIMASRASVIGGFDSTSNVYAAQKYGLKPAGTMAHSFIQLFDDELTAFRKFAETNPGNVILLVDTYDTLNSGVPNAIKVAKELQEKGLRLKAIRIDSGDLAFFARKSRQLLDNAGLQEVQIAASNQLDEYVIRSLKQQNAPIDIFGVGTSLVTGQPDAALDGVYKLTSVNTKPRIKISENLKKTTLPGRKQIARLVDKNHQFLGIDAILQAGEKSIERLTDPFDERKFIKLTQPLTEEILHPVIKNGEIIENEENIETIKSYLQQQLKRLPEEYKRFENPHIYKVGISEKTRLLRNKLIAEHRA